MIRICTKMMKTTKMGTMTNSKVHLDFETRANISVTELGAWLYARQPSCSVISLAYAVDDEPVKLFGRKQIIDYALRELGEYTPVPRVQRLIELAEDPNVLFYAHNAGFERAVWTEVLEKRYGFPPIALHRWRCTAAKAAVMALPRKLELAAKALKVEHRKDMAGHARMLKLSRPRRLSKINQQPFWEPGTAWDDYRAMHCYNLNDVEVERDIDHVLPDLTDAEQMVWFLDQTINQRGIPFDQEGVRIAIDLMEHHADVLMRKFREVTQGQLNSPKQTVKFLKWLKDNGCELPNIQKQTVQKALKDKSIPKHTRKALLIRQSLSKSSTKKLNAMLDRTDDDGRAYDTLLYHGATTGRWSGRGIQIQNFPRNKMKVHIVVDWLYRHGYEQLMFLTSNQIMPFLGDCLRPMVRADEGTEFIAGDFSAIEARVLAWLAGQEDILELFRNDEDVYSHQASLIYGWPVDRKVHITEGMVGKVSILALGYQGGIGAFGQMAKGYGLDLRPVYKSIWKSTTDEEKVSAKRAVGAYKAKKAGDPEILDDASARAADIIKQRWRASNNHTVKFWDKIESAAIAAVERWNSPLPEAEKRDLWGKDWARVPCGRVTYYCQGRGSQKFLMCELPSGRCIAYHRPKIQKKKTPWGAMKPVLQYWGTNSQSGKYICMDAYGGLLTENIVQAVSRDLMAEAMLRLEDAGYPTIFTVHDEDVAQVNKGFGSVAEFEGIMEQPPEWAHGLPIKVEAWRGERYRK